MLFWMTAQLTAQSFTVFEEGLGLPPALGHLVHVLLVAEVQQHRQRKSPMERRGLRLGAHRPPPDLPLLHALILKHLD